MIVDHQPRSIVVRMPNWLGDTVMALPALAALRGARPEARITVMGRWAPLLSGQGVADIVLSYPPRLRDRLHVARSLRPERPDLALLLANSLEAALAAWNWGAKRRLGFDTDGRRWLLTDIVPRPWPRLHQTDEYAVLLRAEGVPVPDNASPAWRLPLHRSSDAEVDALLETAGIPPETRVVGLHLGTAFGPSKLWPPESFGRLAARLAGDGLRPLLLGSLEDRHTALAVAAAASVPLPSLVGRDRPALLPRLLARLRCLVSADTGVAHLAAALGVPTVTLFGPTDPRLTAPRAKAARVLFRQVACSPCFLTDCPIDHICLRGIDPAEVEAHVRDAVA
ncbi:MAG TPA: lipopolysaccharide heptosyltransferase II [Candidatus Methylomirabilis sp.]|nr:lipopolysaccharide heptosyltransferase II [Candidatus Methylomirabilis sp.]